MTSAQLPQPPQPPSEPARWGPSRALLGIVVLLVLASLEASAVAIAGNVKSLAGKLALQAALAVTLVGVAFALAGRDGRPAAAPALGLRRPRGTPVRDAVLAYACYLAFAIAYANLIHVHQKDLTRALGYGHGIAVSILVGLLVVVAAPISEETFFRGFVFGGLRQRLPFIGAALISAAIFGAFHYTGPSSVSVLPQLAVLGVALAWVYERTGSIYPTIAIHMVNNALAFAILTS